METQQKEIRHMQATENGVIFYSTTNQNLACMSSIDSNGNIENTIAVLFNKHFPKSPFIPKSFVVGDGCENNLKYFIVGFFDFIFILLSALLKDSFLLLSATFFTLICSLKLFDFLYTIYELKAPKGDSHSTARFIAASHKVTNAYTDLQRIPTVEEARKYSSFSFNSRFINELLLILNFISVSIAIAIGPVRSFLLYTLFFLIVPRICDLIFKTPKSLPLQKLITSEPTDKEIEVAVACLRYLEETEKDFKVTWVK